MALNLQKVEEEVGVEGLWWVVGLFPGREGCLVPPLFNKLVSHLHKGPPCYTQILLGGKQWELLLLTRLDTNCATYLSYHLHKFH